MKRLFLAIAAAIGLAASVTPWFTQEASADSCVRWRSPGQATEYRGNCPETAQAIYVYLPAKARPMGTLEVVAVKPGAPASLLVLQDRQKVPCLAAARILSLDDISIPKIRVVVGCRGQDHIGEPVFEDGNWMVRWPGDTTNPADVAAKIHKPQILPPATGTRNI